MSELDEDRDRVILRLFVAGSALRSTRAITNTRAFCDLHLTDRCELEVIDIYQQPERAVQDQIVAVPTLLKVSPPPMRRLIGTMHDQANILARLEIPGVAMAEDEG